MVRKSGEKEYPRDKGNRSEKGNKMPESHKDEIKARLNAKLMERKARVKRLAHSVLLMRLGQDELPLLECHALELRSLAYQIRSLRAARLAVDVAE